MDISEWIKMVLKWAFFQCCYCITTTRHYNNYQVTTSIFSKLASKLFSSTILIIYKFWFYIFMGKIQHEKYRISVALLLYIKWLLLKWFFGHLLWNICWVSLCVIMATVLDYGIIHFQTNTHGTIWKSLSLLGLWVK